MKQQYLSEFDFRIVYKKDYINMEFIIIFVLGVLFGFGSAWAIIQSTEQPSKDILKQYGTLSEQLRLLGETTTQLQRILADRGYRGKWGEKRALEILQLAGFEQGKNFRYQSASINDEGKKIVPDFTFEFPNKIFLHMDSKFPLDQYEAYMLANNEVEKKSYLQNFLKSVRSHIDDLKKKGYISVGQGTLNHVLLFVPFESLFRFIHEADNTIIDYALERQVVMCSPLTLYVLLATIRQSVEAFAYSKASAEIRIAIEKVRKEIEQQDDVVRNMKKRLNDAQETFETLIGTRHRRLIDVFAEIENTTRKYQNLTDES